MTCQDCLEKLEDYLDRELDDSQERAMAGHLSGCSLCQARCAELEKLKQEIAWAIEDIPLPAELEGRVLANVLRQGSPGYSKPVLSIERATSWRSGLVLSLLLGPLLILLHPLSVRMLSLLYGMSRVFGRGLYVLSGAIPSTWYMSLGLTGLVVLGLGSYVVWKLVQAFPLREAAS